MATQGNISNKETITNLYLYSNVWGCKWTGEVSYSFGMGLSPTSPYGVTVSESSVDWSVPEQQALRDVLQTYMNVCNVRFIERGFDNSNPTNLVAYKVSNTALGSDTSGMFEVPDGSKTGMNTLNGYFNTSLADWSNFTIGGSGFELLLHEFGHSVGLAHPHDGGGGLSPKPYPGINMIEKDWRDMGDNTLNQGIWSTMSYNDGWLKTADGTDTGLRPASDKSYGYQATPMAFDVSALQFLYGANLQYHTGDDTYTLAHTNSVGTGWTCIWDAGGMDTISNAGANLACRIDLRDALLTNNANGGGHVSGGQGIAGGFTIAKGAVIENAEGGAAADTLIGNSSQNLLRGNAGNDTLDGGANIDTAVYTGLQAQYTFNRLDNTVTDTVADRDGIDSLLSVERLKFTDTMVGLDVGKDQNAGAIYRLYEAAFDRAPKPIGEGYWLNKLDNGASLVEIANEFTATAEFQRVYGGSAPDYTFYVQEIFQHVLGRAPKQAGLDYWTAKLANGESYGAVLAGISESDEHVAKVETLIANGIQYTEVA